ncbi:energy transducer TonB [Marinagarivorans algicola]|uniref:energy transducer TonB n=1 Tax=Marinagarivorans algicola TaxID=1513270 RepID=UPI0006B5B00C|nr:energy transducer TonB [Marinagarivorans algicola]
MAISSSISTGDRLSFTFFAALAVHVFVLLQLSTKMPDAGKMAPTLNITLATNATQEAPEKADFLAQSNQAASGSGDKALELLTDEHADYNDTVIREITPTPQQKTTQAAQQKTETLRTQSVSRLTFKDDLETEQNPEEKTLKAQNEDILRSNPEAAALMAQYDKKRQSEALRPKIRRIQAEATRASIDAQYLHAYNTQVQAYANRNFPQEVLNKKLFGTLKMIVIINPDGTINDVEMDMPSEHALLNQSALQMVYSAAPFDKIPPEVLDGHDKLEIVRIWTFEITGLSVK